MPYKNFMKLWAKFWLLIHTIGFFAVGIIISQTNPDMIYSVASWRLPIIFAVTNITIIGACYVAFTNGWVKKK